MRNSLVAVHPEHIESTQWWLMEKYCICFWSTCPSPSYLVTFGITHGFSKTIQTWLISCSFLLMFISEPTKGPPHESARNMNIDLLLFVEGHFDRKNILSFLKALKPWKKTDFVGKSKKIDFLTLGIPSYCHREWWSGVQSSPKRKA